MGHRGVAHTADVRVEAWGSTREECLGEAVAGLVSTFADASSARVLATYETRLDPGEDEELLRSILDEVIFQLDATGRLPIATDVAPADDAVEVRMRMADAATTPQIGAPPKGVSTEDLRIEPREGGWWCAVTIDV